MATHNRINLTGYITTGKDENGDRNPLILRQIGEGDRQTAALSFRIAVPRDYKGKDGKRIYDFFNASLLGRQAEFVAKYFKPGDPIVLDGDLRNRSYTDQDGNSHTITEVNVQFAGFPLTAKADGEAKPAAQPQAKPAPAKTNISAAEDFEEVEGDDLPF